MCKLSVLNEMCARIRSCFMVSALNFDCLRVTSTSSRCTIGTVGIPTVNHHKINRRDPAVSYAIHGELSSRYSVGPYGRVFVHECNTSGLVSGQVSTLRGLGDSQRR